MSRWSENLIETTRNILYDMPAESFSSNGGCCHLKNIDGRFGFIKFEDAINDNYTIHVSDPENREKIENYDSINTLIGAGWAVD